MTSATDNHPAAPAASTRSVLAPTLCVLSRAIELLADGDTIAAVIRIASLLLSLTGCAGQSVTNTGFLTSYGDMKPTEAHTADLIYVDREYIPGNYHSVIVEPVAWRPAPDTPSRSDQVISQLQADFRGSLVEELGKQYAILDPAPAQPGPGVLRVRAAITNTRRANWWINAPVRLAGIGLAAVGVPGGFPAPDPGGASEEMEVLDAGSGQRMVAIATYNNGMPWNVLGEFQEMGHARRAFSLAADLLREQLTGSTDAAEVPR